MKKPDCIADLEANFNLLQEKAAGFDARSGHVASESEFQALAGQAKKARSRQRQEMHGILLVHYVVLGSLLLATEAFAGAWLNQNPGGILLIAAGVFYYVMGAITLAFNDTRYMALDGIYQSLEKLGKSPDSAVVSLLSCTGKSCRAYYQAVQGANREFRKFDLDRMNELMAKEAACKAAN